MTTPTTDWRRAVVVAAVGGGAFWAVAAQVLLAFTGSAVTLTTISVIAIAAIGGGVPLYRRSGSAEIRSYGMGLALAPLTGVAPIAVFSLAGLLIHVVT